MVGSGSLRFDRPAPTASFCIFAWEFAKAAIQWTSTVTVADFVRPAASVAVSVYVVVFRGETLTQRSNDGQTAFDCGSSVTDFAFETL